LKTHQVSSIHSEMCVELNQLVEISRSSRVRLA
jgi:hypothetical protein